MEGLPSVATQFKRKPSLLCRSADFDLLVVKAPLLDDRRTFNWVEWECPVALDRIIFLHLELDNPKVASFRGTRQANLRYLSRVHSAY
jgi:hypothetical protein